MKKIFAPLIAAAIFGGFFITSSVAQVQTKSSLSTEINTKFPDNTSGAITPQILRSVTDDFVTSWQQATTVNAQTGTTYTVQTSDYGKLITLTNSSPVSVSIPQAAGSFSQFNFYAFNGGGGAVTLTPTSGSICGSTSATLTTNQGLYIVSDGSNYQCVGLSSGSGTGIVSSLSNIASLQAQTFSSSAAPKIILLQSNYFSNDGGGAFYYDSSDTSSADNGGTTILTSTSGTALRYKRLYDGCVDITWFGAKTDGSATVTAQYNSATAVSTKCVSFPSQGVSVPQYRFDTQPNALPANVSLVPEGFEIITLYRNYTPGVSSDGFIRVLGSNHSISNFIFDNPVSSSGGDAISCVASSIDGHCSFSNFSGNYITGSGTWRRGINIDGSAKTTAAQGIRDVKLDNNNIFQATEASLYLKGCKNCSGNGVGIVSTPSTPSLGNLYITGDGTVSSDNISFSGPSAEKIFVDFANNVNLNFPFSSLININSTSASSVLINSLIGGTVTNNGNYSFVYVGGVEYASITNSPLTWAVNGITKFGISSTGPQIYGSSSGVITQQAQAAAGTYNWNLPITAGLSGQALLSAGGGSSPMTWGNAITGPGSSTDKAIARFNGTGGTAIQNSVVTIADTTGVIAGTQGLTLSGSTSGTLAVKSAAISGSNTLTLPAGTTDFSATGGTSQVVQQTSAGGALTVGQLAASNLSNGTSGSGAVCLVTSCSLVTPLFSTSITGPLVIGGTGTGSSLNLQSTSGVGATDTINFKVGNNGATTAAFFNTGGALQTGGNGVPANLSATLVNANASSSIFQSAIANAMYQNTNANGPNLQFFRSRGTTIGSYAAQVQSGDELGVLYFGGSDNAASIGFDAKITVTVDATPSGANNPTRFDLYTKNTAGTLSSKFGVNSLGLVNEFSGAAVSSATAIVPTGNVFHVTGTTSITSITSTGIVAGTQITIIFDGILTFTDGNNLKLAGNFSTTSDDTITLKYDGTNWYEMSRSIN